MLAVIYSTPGMNVGCAFALEKSCARLPSCASTRRATGDDSHERAPLTRPSLKPRHGQSWEPNATPQPALFASTATSACLQPFHMHDDLSAG